MSEIYLAEIIDINPNSAFINFLSNAEKNSFICHITGKKKHLRRKTLKAILSTLGIDVLEYIINLYNPNIAMAYLQILVSSQNFFTIKREISRFNRLKEIQKSLLEDFALLLKEGVSNHLVLQDEENMSLQSFHRALFKHCASSIIHFLIMYLRQVRKINFQEVKRIKDEIKEPIIPVEIKINLSRELLNSLEIYSVSRIKGLANDGADVNYQDENGYTPLIKAIILGDYKKVKYLLEAGANPNCKSRDGCTPLITAIENGRIKITEILLKHGANSCTVKPDSDETALITAIRKGCFKSVRALIDYGALIDIKKHQAEEALFLAMRNKDLRIIKLLLEHGIGINYLYKNKYTPLMYAVATRDTDIVKILLKYNPDLDMQDAGGRTALLLAASFSRLQIVTLLLEKGANPNICDKNKSTALSEAIKNSRITAVVKALLQFNANPNINDINGNTALTLAVQSSSGFPGLRKLLKNKRVKVTSENLNKALMAAIMPRPPMLQDVVIRQLILYGADIERQSEGQTPLIKAVSCGTATIVKELLTSGANINAQTPTGTALIRAVENNDIKMTELLLKRGANPNLRGWLKSDTPLITAIKKYSMECVRLLLAYSADPNIVGREGNSAFTIANGLYTDEISETLEIRKQNNTDLPGKEAAYTELDILSEELVRQNLPNINALQELIKKDEIDTIRALLSNCRISGQIKFVLLAEALVRENYEIAKLLLDYGTNPNLIHGSDYYNPLYNAITWGSIDLVKLLLEYHAETAGLELFYYKIVGEIKKNNYELMQVLLQYGMNPNLRNCYKDETLLITATKASAEATARVLLAHGANPDIIINNQSALTYAIENRDLNIIRLLLEHGADLNIPGEPNNTPITLAIKKGNDTVIRLILERVNLPKISNHDAGLAIAWASKKGFSNLLERILKNMPASYVPHKTINTALMLAVKNGYIENVRLLLEYGISPNIKDHSGNTPLHYAAAMGNKEIVKLLLAFGAALNGRNEKGSTPITEAACNCFPGIVRILLKASLQPKILGVLRDHIITLPSFYHKYPSP